MKRAMKLKHTRDFGRAANHLQCILDSLKAGNERVHPFENDLQETIKQIDKLFTDFVRIYFEDERPFTKRCKRCPSCGKEISTVKGSGGRKMVQHGPGPNGEFTCTGEERPRPGRHLLWIEWVDENVWADEVAELPPPGSCSLYDGWLDVNQHFVCFEGEGGWKCKRGEKING